MKYKTREYGATVTVFAPYDCDNNCPFCINKEEYKDTTGFSTIKIIKSIKLMDEITPYCDFVFTGGEPLADLDKLQSMLDAVPDTHKIFINTTLPTGKYREHEIINFLNKNKEKITGLNVSRHLRPYIKEASDYVFDYIELPIRINCVLYGTHSSEDLKNFITRFSHTYIPIQFRRDYRYITPKNLYDLENDVIYNQLKSIFNFKQIKDKLRMRCGYDFEYSGKKITYHKTLPYSKIFEGDYEILYDIIIRQTGEIMDDWNEYGEPLDLLEYRNVEYEVER